MKLCHTLVCFFVLSLQDGNTGLINAETIITGMEGGNITHECYFSFTFHDKWKIFCKEECEEQDILVKTTDNRAQSGRYSIKYDGTGGLSAVLYVSITNLTKSDSGRYTCRLDGGYLANKEFEIRVEDEPTRPLTTRPPSVPSTSTPTTTQSSNVVPGSSTPSSASTDTSSQSGQRQRTETDATIEK
ncbi:hepatitis A virus cellular receptor 1 homolog [Sparus aurata]|uniref:hepatitis A virus cellular receptor 1 homolog n=1 Tax=Sparus aurata TaxID=8175 RepID=UPI0011C1A263|nr:hepatitis A virus cellular receptor 1 homolog [Sparus aurata]